MATIKGRGGSTREFKRLKRMTALGELYMYPI